jgi:hypothetical protein
VRAAMATILIIILVKAMMIPLSVQVKSHLKTSFDGLASLATDVHVQVALQSLLRDLSELYARISANLDHPIGRNRVLYERLLAGSRFLQSGIQTLHLNAATSPDIVDPDFFFGTTLNLTDSPFRDFCFLDKLSFIYASSFSFLKDFDRTGTLDPLQVQISFEAILAGITTQMPRFFGNTHQKALDHSNWMIVESSMFMVLVVLVGDKLHSTQTCRVFSAPNP